MKQTIKRSKTWKSKEPLAKGRHSQTQAESGSLKIADLDRKQETFQESAEKYQNILLNIEEGYFEIDLAGNLIFFNPSLCRISGYSARELVDMNNRDYATPETARRMLKTFHNIYRTGNSVKITDYEIIRKDGTTRILELSASLKRDSSGQPTGFRGIARDVTDHKQAEKALKRSEAKYRELVENANSIIVRGDAGGNVTFINEYAQRFFGYSENEILGKNALGTILPTEDNTGKKMTIMIDDIGRHPERYVYNENENMRRNGERVWIAWTNKVIRDETGSVVEILSIGNDVTERKIMQEKLRESENWYRTIFETTGTGTIIIDEDMSISHVNQEFEKLTGFSSEEVLGRKWPEFISQDDRERMKGYHGLRRTNPDTAPRSYEFKGLHKSGRLMNLLCTVSVIPGTKSSVASMLNITEQKHLDKELRDSLAQYRLLADNVSDVIWVLDMNSHFTYISPSTKQLRGYCIEEAVNQTLEDILTPSSFEIATKALAEQRAIEDAGTGDPLRSLTMELELNCKDGSTIWAEINMTGLREPDGRAYGILGITRDISDRKKAEDALKRREKELDVKTRYLAEANTTLKVLLQRREKDKTNLQADILSNVNELIMPHIDQLRKSLGTEDQKSRLQVIETNLNNIISPFLRTLTIKHMNFTPKEIKVANLVKEGKTSKEIATLLHLSPRSIEFHRDNIRKKLGLQNKKVNLQSYLHAFT
ncbi:MAG: PAS domain S-box protein [Deltaproteobacteria bacterium]|nr:PAS domain S-box protein [Deltaproteobacteria bacterium]